MNIHKIVVWRANDSLCSVVTPGNDATIIVARNDDRPLVQRRVKYLIATAVKIIAITQSIRSVHMKACLKISYRETVQGIAYVEP